MIEIDDCYLILNIKMKRVKCIVYMIAVTFIELVPWNRKNWTQIDDFEWVYYITHKQSTQVNVKM